MIKLIRAEFKKMFLNPFMYIISGFLIVALALTAIIYKPIGKNDNIIEIEGANVSAIYSTFNSTGLNSKSYFDNYIISSQNKIANYNTTNTILDNFNEKMENLIYTNNTHFSLHRIYGEDAQIVSEARAANKTSYENMYFLWHSTFNSNVTKAVVEQGNYLSALSFIQKCISTFDNSVNNKNAYILNKLAEYDAVATIQNYVNSIKIFQPNQETLTQCNNIVAIAQNNLSYISTEIIDFGTGEKASSSSTTDIYQMRKLISKYKHTVEMCNNIVSSLIFLNAIEGVNNTVLNSYKGYSDINLYQEKETLTKNIFMLENGKFPFDYNTAFTINKTSGIKTNAYDYVYFSLKIFIAIIIVFLIVLSAETIAGEYNTGTIKQLAMKPFKRSKILTGKLIALILVGTTLLFISYIVALLAGLILFGLPSLPILTVFNSSNAFVISSFALSLIYLIFLILQLVFYIVIAVSIGVLLKNNTVSVTLSMVIFFLTIIFSVVSNMNMTTSTILNFFTPINSNLFKYFGGSFIGFGGGVLSNILNTPLVINSSFTTSLTGILSTMAIFLIPTYAVFTYRDIK